MRDGEKNEESFLFEKGKFCCRLASTFLACFLKINFQENELKDFEPLTRMLKTFLLNAEYKYDGNCRWFEVVSEKCNGNRSNSRKVDQKTRL